MVGIQTRATLGPGDGPALRYCSQEAFRALRREHSETAALMRQAHAAGLRECLIWKTCSRFELYGWPTASLTARQLALLTFPQADPTEINILVGAAARTHMLRTAAGLNSHLVGDAEVVDQLDASRRAAQHAGTALAQTDALVDDTIAAAARLREETPWRQFEHRYCAAALSRLVPAASLSRNILVIGGSTTSASILETLVDSFKVPPASIRLIYRGWRKGVLARRLHTSIGAGHVTAVEAYTDPTDLAAIADADLVFLGIDQREPIAALDDFKHLPITIFDFNTFGSLRPPSPPRGGPEWGWQDSLSSAAPDAFTYLCAKQIDHAIDSFNLETTLRPDFAQALAAAESWIARHAKTSSAPSSLRLSVSSPLCEATQ